MSLIYSAPRRHVCVARVSLGTPGSVYVCTCGRGWVAYELHPMSGWAPNYVGWRREGLFAQWRRTRAARRA